MPTGYTSIIGDRESVSFEEFAMRCARGMGACISMRDNSLDAPIPDRFEPDTTFYAERERAAQEQIALFEAMSTDDAARAADEEHEKTIADVNAANERYSALRGKYERMRVGVQSWVPPTQDHNGLKDFMLEQLEQSMRFDCIHLTTPDRVSPERWRLTKLDEAHRARIRAREGLLEEVERTESRNKWLADLRGSLNDGGTVHP
jgi:hypothetical protein